MVLVDTSVWVDHFRSGNRGLEILLNEGYAVCHPFIIGELACGNLSNRAEILSLLHALPSANKAKDDEVLHCIESYKLMGKGLGYIDMHLIVSALLSSVRLWTLDRKLRDIASFLRLDYRQTTGR